MFKRVNAVPYLGEDAGHRIESGVDPSSLNDNPDPKGEKGRGVFKQKVFSTLNVYLSSLSLTGRFLVY